MTLLAKQSPARAFNRANFKTIGFGALGGALEFYEFTIFVFFAGQIGILFFPPSIPDWARQAQVFGVFAAGNVVRPLGGLCIAHFGDSLGRKRAFMFSLCLMALPTLALGLMPTYKQLGLMAPMLLLALRTMQGAAVGGEIPGAWVFVSEHVPDRYVGRACGMIGAGVCAGLFSGALIAWMINRFCTPDEVLAYSWRIPFILGGVLGLLAAYQRRWLKETPAFQNLRLSRPQTTETPLHSLVRHHQANALTSMSLSASAATIFVVVMLMTPAMLREQHHIPVVDAMAANCAAILALGIGCVVAGVLVDLIGPGLTITCGLALVAASNYWLNTTAVHQPSLLLPIYALTGFSVGTVGAVGSVLVRAFPATIRYTGVSFSYNIPYALFGGFAPLCASFLTGITPLGSAHYVAAACVIGILAASAATVIKSRKQGRVQRGR